MSILSSIAGLLYSNDKKVITENDASVCTAWGYISDGTTPVLSETFNISGVIRTAAGNYSVSFLTPMDTATYIVTGASANTAGSLRLLAAVQNNTVNGFNIVVTNQSGTVSDFINFGLVVHGGKNNV